VLEWVLRRCDDEIEAIETPIGLVPREEDLDIAGLDLGAEAVHQLLTVDEEALKGELPQVREHLEKFGDRLPAPLRAQLETLEQRLGA
jgi:phosphoenolpyruvate carboxykinase (GTP)